MLHSAFVNSNSFGVKEMGDSISEDVLGCFPPEPVREVNSLKDVIIGTLELRLHLVLIIAEDFILLLGHRFFFALFY